MNFLQIQADEKVTSILVMPKSTKQKSLALMMVTKNGTAKNLPQIALRMFVVAELLLFALIQAMSFFLRFL